MAEDDARISEIRRRHQEGPFGECETCDVLARFEALASQQQERLDALTAERDAARAWSARWKAVAKRLWVGIHKSLDQSERLAARMLKAEASRDTLAARLAAAEAAGRAVVRAWDCDHQGMCDCMYDAMDALRAALAGSREQAAAIEGSER